MGGDGHGLSLGTLEGICGALSDAPVIVWQFVGVGTIG